MKLLFILAIGLPGIARGQLLHYLPEWSPVVPGAEAGMGLLSNPSMVNEAGEGLLILAAGQPFAMAEWKSGLAALLMPVAGWNLGLAAVYSGLSGYAETCPVFALGRSLGAISVAILGGYDQWRAGGFGSAGSLVYGAGFTWNPSPQLKASLGIRNPVPVSPGSRSGERPAGRITLQFRYQPSEKWGMLLIIASEEERAGEIFASWSYRPMEALQLSMSWQSGSASYAWAAAWTWKRYTTGLSVRLHPQLGITPGIYLLLPLNKDDDEN